MLNALLMTVVVFLGMLVCGEIGRRIGLGHRARNPRKKLAEGSGAAEAAVFALLGLLIAFTFSGAASRFEDRRHLVTDEANAIGTAYLRIDLLPADARPELRRLFRRYTEVRASTYQQNQSVFARFLAGENQGPVAERLAQAATLQQAIWQRAIAALDRPDAPPRATVVLVPALNEMIDITTTRVMATRNHPPIIVFFLLVGFGLVGSVLVGYHVRQRQARLVPLHPVCSDPVADDVRDRRPGISASRIDPGEFRPDPGRTRANHAMNDLEWPGESVPGIWRCRNRRGAGRIDAVIEACCPPQDRPWIRSPAVRAC